MSLILPPTRRGMFVGLLSGLVAAPALVRASSLMPVRALPEHDLFWLRMSDGDWACIERGDGALYWRQLPSQLLDLARRFPPGRAPLVGMGYEPRVPIGVELAR